MMNRMSIMTRKNMMKQMSIMNQKNIFMQSMIMKKVLIPVMKDINPILIDLMKRKVNRMNIEF